MAKRIMLGILAMLATPLFPLGIISSLCYFHLCFTGERIEFIPGFIDNCIKFTLDKPLLIIIELILGLIITFLPLSLIESMNKKVGGD